MMKKKKVTDFYFTIFYIFHKITFKMFLKLSTNLCNQDTC